jgi:signal transduction histidine kinase
MRGEPKIVPRRKAIRRIFRSAVISWLVLAIGIPASFFLFTFIQDSVEDVARLQFEREANSAHSIIEHRLRSYSDVLYALRALFASDDSVGRLDFHRFVESLGLKRRYPGFISINYAKYVPAKDKRRFEESVRRDTSLDPRGYPQFSIRPAGERHEYFVLVYLEPMVGYEFAFGLDLGANPMAEDSEKVAEAVRLHRDSGSLSASAQQLRVRLSKEAIYLAMRLGVYRNGMPVETVVQRRAAYVGSVGAAFDVESLMRGALSEDTLRYMRFRLFDAGSAVAQSNTRSPEPSRLLFDSDQLTRRSPNRAQIDTLVPAIVHVLPVQIAGRLWEFQYSARAESIVGDLDRILPPLVLAGGLLSSVLLFGVLYSLSFSRSRAVEIANEITKDLRESEIELRNSTEQLQAMSRRLVDVQESERRQFSRELHDRVGQNLTALSISVDILKSQISGNGNGELRSRLNDAAALLESTSGAIENVMSELRPPMLDDYGLLPALQWYASEFATRTGIQTTVGGDEGIGRLPQASEIALFRIMQEALNNVAKHAHAKHVSIALERSGSHFTMSILDDGVGLETASTSTSRRRAGLGMVTMRERTQAVGGQFEIGAAPGHGTRVTVRIPC